MTSVDTLPQPKEQPFGNSIRGDVSNFRFDGAHSASPLPDKHVRRIISHDFTAQKSQQNDVSLARQMEKPHGRRWSAAHGWKELHKQQRMQQEHAEETKQLKHISDTLAGILRQLPEHQTSAANPLRPKSAGAAAESVDADPAANGSSPSKLPKTVSYIERSHNLKDSLEMGSLAPTGDGSEAAAAGAAAEDAAAVAVAAEKEKQQQLLQQLAEQVIKEYPHGLPKRLQHELRSRGVMLPALGFGETQSAPSFDASFSTR